MDRFSPYGLSRRVIATLLLALTLTGPGDATERPGFDINRLVIPSAKGAALRFTTDGFGNYLDAFGAVPAFVPDDHGGFIRFFQLWGGDARRGFVAFEVARQCQGRRYRTRFELPFSEVTFAPIDFRLHVSAIARQGTPCENEAALWVESDPLIDAIAQSGNRFGNKLYPSVAAALAATAEER